MHMHLKMVSHSKSIYWCFHPKIYTVLSNARMRHLEVSQKRRDLLIKSLRPIIPSNRQKFWEDMTVVNASDEENENGDF